MNTRNFSQGKLIHILHTALKHIIKLKKLLKILILP